ncbi:MAG: Maf family protein [Oscillospiraceae bacterium]|nr:Maf family protein [Oscillospiraceae bacterium]
MQLVLASQSPRRSEILTNAGYSFCVRVSQTAENPDFSLAPGEIVTALAAEKARAAERQPGEVILAADTVVVLDGAVLGKPKNKEDAAAMLACLSGRAHEVYTGVCLLGQEDERCFFVKTEVTFYSLGRQEIADYIDTGEPFDKAGAYGIQGRGAVLVEHICGDYFNVMGLPIAQTSRELKRFDIVPRA